MYFIIDSTTNQVLTCGNFRSTPNYDSTTQYLVQKDIILNPSIVYATWYYDPVNDLFYQG